jgi:hypothetical protein
MSENNDQLTTLNRYFASYRERDGVLSIEEAKEALARPVMLQTKTTRTLKPIAIMSTIFAAAVSLVLLRLFSGTPDVVVQNQNVESAATPSHAVPTSRPASNAGYIVQSGDGKAEPLKGLNGTESVVPLPVASLDSLGVIEVPESILAQLGIATNGLGSVSIYVQQSEKDAYMVTIDPHAVDLKQMKPVDVPASLRASGLSPIFATTGAGKQRLYHCSPDSSTGHSGFRVSTYDDAEAEAFRNAVQNSSKIPGLTFMGYNTTSMTDDNGHRTDTITVMLGNDIPALPTSPAPLNEYPDAVQKTANKMAEYLMGKGTMPSLKDLPTYLTLKADTMTCEKILDQLDRAEHTEYIQKAHEALKNLNKLVPIAIRTTEVRGTLTNNDYIFWYEPTGQFLAAMPEDVRTRIDSRIASANAKSTQVIQSILATAPTQDTIRVDYTLSKPTTLGVGISDLTGRLLWHKQYDVESGSGTLQLHLGMQIEPGIYLLTTTTSSGERHSSRLFVDGPVQNNSAHAANTDNRSIPETTAAVHFVELTKEQLAKLGVEDSRAAKGDGVSLYTTYGKEVSEMTVLRDWGLMIPSDDVPSTKLPAGLTPSSIIPPIITDGLGKKRMITMQSTDGKTPQTEKEVSDQIGNMIPILIRDRNDGSPLGTRDLVLWYLPTPELRAMLPANAEQPVAQVAATNEKAKEVASVVSPSHSAIASAAVFPNPSHGNINVHVNLQADRTLNLRLLDLSGKELVRQSGLNSTPKGGADLRLDATAVGEGVYILDVTSDVGEHVFSKVMIVR